MNRYKFSPSTISFYPIEFLDAYVEAGTLPDDIVDVSDEVYAEYCGTPPSGKTRGSKNGQPAWVDIPSEEISS
ncbi:hypothetical protein [Serratia symbiotica]|uniref:hypothetical protein n=1 Tax=Serratia symbiotica TaxID=138074 RepID=UPI00135FB438|nr:hypothetical protein [Serratia symbiotica]MBQ0956918.1 hypothetical protein [Serratia symbiotica]